jgi:hypothetical protein
MFIVRVRERTCVLNTRNKTKSVPKKQKSHTYRFCQRARLPAPHPRLVHQTNETTKRNKTKSVKQNENFKRTDFANVLDRQLCIRLRQLGRQTLVVAGRELSKLLTRRLVLVRMLHVIERHEACK